MFTKVQWIKAHILEKNLNITMNTKLDLILNYYVCIFKFSLIIAM